MRFSDDIVIDTPVVMGPEYRPDLLNPPFIGPEYRPDLMKKPLPKWVLPAAGVGLLVIGGLILGRR